MSQPLFTGALTRLVAFDPDRGAELYAKWYRDSEFSRLYDFFPVRPRDLKRTQEYMRKQEAELDGKTARFHIVTLEGDEIIGECDLESGNDQHGEGWVGIALGERNYWGRGYGRDALRLLLDFGFAEWNLHRISLSAFDFNPRALRSYERMGFKLEGSKRGHMKRGGHRHNTVYMGILRSEWETTHNG